MTIPHKCKATWLGGNERSGGKGAGEHGPDKGLSRRGVSEESGMGEAIDGLPVPVESTRVSLRSFPSPCNQPRTCLQSPATSLGGLQK